MDNFEITSMFVGILLNKTLFSNLFLKLRSYLKEHRLEDYIILQGIDSLHLSLYYLDNNLPEGVLGLLSKIRKDLEGLELNITSFDYFYDQGKEKIAYFKANRTEKLKKINQIFRLSIPNNVLENSYDFIPHVTIFTIKDYPSFKKHKQNIERMLINFSEEIKDKNVFKSVNIFKVDSTKEPEVQLIIE